MQIIILISCFLAGGAVAVIYMMARSTSTRKEIETKYFEADRQSGILNERIGQLSQQFKTVEQNLSEERRLVIELNKSLTEQQGISNGLREKLENQKKDIETIQQKFTAEFENLSSKILDEKSKKFTEQNRTNLDIILNPLKEKIKEFENKVEQSYKIESAERNTLKGEIKSLIELNKQISEEANNLARALKGDTKKQGNWGEVILERILERSGLTRGAEYEIQVSMNNEDGSRFRPDVVVNLPDNKHLIIDAKVSLIAYENMVNATSEEDREKYLKDHINSVRTHIKLLSEKNYYTSMDLTSPDFVLIFMPIEPSFSTAVQSDSELFNYAWDKKIVLVSPTTLLATLKTISYIWKQEKQNRNAQEIARIGGTLYDKFSNFLKDMTNIGDKIKAAQQSHEEAVKKLSSGPGNLIRRAEDMKKLGAKTTKDLPGYLLEEATENDATPE